MRATKRSRSASQISIVEDTLKDARAERLRQEVDALARIPQEANGLNACPGSLAFMQEHNLQSSLGVDQGIHRQICMRLVKQLESMQSAVEALNQENDAIRRRLGVIADGHASPSTTNARRMPMGAPPAVLAPVMPAPVSTVPGLDAQHLMCSSSRSVPPTPLFPTRPSVTEADQPRSFATPPTTADETVNFRQSMHALTPLLHPLPLPLDTTLEAQPSAFFGQATTRLPVLSSFERLSALPAHARELPSQQQQPRPLSTLSTSGSALGSASLDSICSSSSLDTQLGQLTSSLRPNFSSSSLHSLGSETSEYLLTYLLNTTDF